MPTTIGSDAYAKYSNLDSLPYNCVKYLMEQNQMVWKLLKYNTPDAWDQADLTWAEKSALIYNGSDDTSLFHVFLDQGQPDVVYGEQSQIRISTYTGFPDNRSVGTMGMLFEIYCHYKVNHLSNYKTRTDMILQIFIDTFNGLDSSIVGGIGKLHFDIWGNPNDRFENAGQLPFRGKWMIMSLKTD